MVNSRYPLVCATPSSSGRKGLHQKGSSFSRSYGCNLPSSLTIVLPIALVFSTRPPVLVWGTGAVPTHCRAFLGSMESVTSPEAARHRVSGCVRTGFPWTSPYTLTPGQPSPGLTYPPASPHCLPPSSGSVHLRRDSPLATGTWYGRGHGGTGISTGCASTTPVGLALAPDSPWVD